MANLYVMGIDGGTESVRIGVFDLNGNLICSSQQPYQTRFPYSGWAEQEPEEWWNALKLAMNRLLRDSGIDPSAIRGIGLDATSCTVVFLDHMMKPLRPALLWMDVRAAEEARDIAETGNPALKYNGYGNVSAEWMPCKALWVKRHEPEIYHGSAVVCEYIDYLNYRLTGVMAGSTNNATIRWYYNDEEEGFPTRFYDEIGLEDLISKFPQSILDMGQPIGVLSKKAATDLGLPEGIIIAQGGADAFVGMIGLNAVQPGRLAFITGSSHLHLGMCRKAFHEKGIFGTYPNAVMRGLHTVEGGQISTGSIMQWFKNHFLNGYDAEAAEYDTTVYGLMEKRANEVPLGSDGLILLDSFQGNRTPLVDPGLRGGIWGLSLHHRPEHIFRAIMEGIAYGTEYIFRTFKKIGYDITDVYACGGPTKSRLWMQIHSDVCGIPIQIPKVQEAPLLGSAILASVAAKLYPNIHDAANHMVSIKERIEPNLDNHEAYKFFVDQYIETYQNLGSLMRKMTEHHQSGIGGRSAAESSPVV